jgi:hypothetical protein
MSLPIKAFSPKEVSQIIKKNKRTQSTWLWPNHRKDTETTAQESNSTTHTNPQQHAQAILLPSNMEICSNPNATQAWKTCR